MLPHDFFIIFYFTFIVALLSDIYRGFVGLELSASLSFLPFHVTPEMNLCECYTGTLDEKLLSLITCDTSPVSEVNGLVWSQVI